jgi:predicted oxidoreductase (fatty acid repression mutant protein)
MIMNNLENIQKRRSYYAINKEVPADKDEIIQLIQQLTELTPDAFNMKSAKVVVALDEQQDRLWDAVYDAFGGKVSRDKVDSFKAGYGTVLFFIDEDVVKGMQEKFPSYADNFDKWSHHANGMLQFNIWSGLRGLDLGASLQHYNPVINESVAKLFDIPKSWNLIAQMPFGGIVQEPEAKPAEDIDQRVWIKD